MIFVLLICIGVLLVLTNVNSLRLLSCGRTPRTEISSRRLYARNPLKPVVKNDKNSPYKKFIDKFMEKEDIKVSSPASSSKSSAKDAKLKKEKVAVAKVLLEDLNLGDKLRGKVVTVRENGLFIDVGAAKDGFLHIKDCSDKYFIEDLSTRFSVGQELEVYIKFVDPKMDSLALQLFPYQFIPPRPLTLSWTDLAEKASLPGTVVKTSEYGVYVDIGAPALGFLQRRKILSNRRQRKLKSWELCPLGSEHTCYIYKVDEKRKRIELTTYPPDRWEGIFDLYGPQSTDVDEEEETNEDDELSEDIANEEIGGTTRARNAANARKILIDDVMDEIDEDDDEDYADDEDYEDVDDEEVLSTSEEILSAEEIRRLTGRNILADSYTTVNSVTNDDEEDMYAGDDDEEMELDEMFAELSDGRPYITFTDVREWDVIKAILEQGYMTREKLKNIFIRSGAVRGKLEESRFGRFVDLFEEEMTVINGGAIDEDDGEDGDDDDYDDFLDVKAFNSDSDVDDDDNDDDDSEDVYEEDSDEYDEEDVESTDIDFGHDMSDIERETKLFEKRASMVRSDGDEDEDEYYDDEEVEQMQEERKIAETAFANIVGNKRFATVEDVLRWDVCVGLLRDHSATVFMLRELFREATSKSQGRMGLDEFLLFRDDIKVLSGDDDEPLFTVADQVAMMEELEKMQSAKAIKAELMVQKGNNGKKQEEEEEEEEEEDYDDEDYDDDEDEYEYLDDEDYEEEDYEEEADATTSRNNKLIDSLVTKKSPATLSQPKSTAVESVVSGSISGQENFDHMSDDDLLHDVFEDIASGKKYIRAKDLLNWDFILDLLADSVLTEQELEQKVEALSVGKGMDIKGFDRLVDDLVQCYEKFEESRPDAEEDEVEEGDYEEQEEYEETGDFDEDTADDDSDVVKSEYVLVDSSNEANSSKNDLEDGLTNEEDEDAIVLDPRELFNELSKDGKFVTFEAIRKWEFVRSMSKTGELNTLQFEHLMDHFETETPKKLALQEFEDLLDEIIILCGGEVEDAFESDFISDEEEIEVKPPSKGFKR